MVTTQMKTDAQRFGNGKKGFNVKQVEEMLENAGGSYTAGTGITISDDKAISIDETIVALKSEIPDHEWKLFDNTDWSELFGPATTTRMLALKDIKILLYRSSDVSYPFAEVYIPKGNNCRDIMFILNTSASTAISYTPGLYCILSDHVEHGTLSLFSQNSNYILKGYGNNLIRVEYSQNWGTSFTKRTTTEFSGNSVLLYVRD